MKKGLVVLLALCVAAAFILSACGETKKAVEEKVEQAVEDVKDAAEGVVEDAKEAVEGAAEDVKEAAEGVVEDAKEAVEGAVEDVKEAAEGVVEDAKEAVEGAVEGAEEAAEGAKEAVEGAVEDAKEAVEGVAEDAEAAVAEAGEAVEDAAEEVAEGAEEVAEDAEAAVEEAVEGAEEAVEEAAEEVAEGAEEVVEGAEEAAEEVVEGAEEAVEGAEEAVEEAAEDAEAAVEEVAEDAEEAAEEVAEDAEEAVEEAAEDAEEAVEEAAEEVAEEVEEAAEGALVSEALIDPISDWSQYDELITAIKAETDMAKRTEMMHQAEDILMATYCVIPIYYYNDVYMQKDYVDGIYANNFATKFFMYATMSNDSTTLKLNLASEPDYLDPALNSSVDGACLAANSFSGLYTYNAEGQTVPACAEGYELSEDGLTYTVTLKEGLKWSDGTDLTAADFEYSWKRATDPAVAADYAYMFSGFDGYVEGETTDLNVTAVDDRTLVFVLTAPCAYMEDLMAFPTFYPVQKAWVEEHATAEAPGAWCQEAGFPSNGAYKCTEWNHDTSMTYEKNEYWYDADKVTIEKLEFMLSADDTAIYAAYNDGSIDFADSVPTDEIATLLADENPEFHIVDELGTYYVAFNANSKLFEGKTAEQAAAMREAFSLLIDRDYICENIGQTGQVAANAFIPLGMADGNGGVFKETAEEGYYDAYAINNDYDATVAKAVELLKFAGFEFDDEGKLSAETPISVEYLTNESSGHIAIAESMQQDLAVVGIDMTIQVQDWNVFLEERKNGNFDFAREGWIADFNDPINMLEMWITASGNNDCQFGRTADAAEEAEEEAEEVVEAVEEAAEEVAEGAEEAVEEAAEAVEEAVEGAEEVVEEAVEGAEEAVEEAAEEVAAD